MLGSLKRFFATPGLVPDHGDVAEWAKRCGHGFKRAREDAGFIVEGTLDGRPWRMEWGPPQRDFIEGRELRLRMEAGLPGDMQMLVLTKPLLETLERRTFEDSTQSMQTQIDTSTPEEMRWLVMFQRVSLASMKALRPHFGVVANVPDAALAWLEGPLAELLDRASQTLLQDEPPFVLMTHRGKVYLRLQAPDADATAVANTLALFETAVAQAVRAAGGRGETSDWPSTSTTAWQTLTADEPPAPPRR